MPSSSPLSRRVLVFAYYFPPMGLSGVQRVAKLVKYLPEHGWQPTVVTAQPGAYFAFDDTLSHEVEAAGVRVRRTRSLDPTRLFGRASTVALPTEARRRRLTVLSQLVFVPDNKIGWLPFAVREGLRVIREEGAEVVLSSAPPYTCHLAAALVARIAGVPLVLDYRDDWTDNPRHAYPTSLHRRLNLVLERAVLARARAVTTINTPIAHALDRRARRSLAEVIPQGFDPADFDAARRASAADAAPRRFRLTYTGVFYDVQTPDVFLTALARFLERVPAARAVTRARFVGLFPETSRPLVDGLGLGEVVELDGYRTHTESVAALLDASVLWMTIGDRPGAEGISTGKLFEYIGARKPILALVPEGAARAALVPYGAAEIVAPDDAEGAAAAIERLFAAWRADALPEPEEACVAPYDRRAIAGRVAGLLARVTRRS